MPNKNIKKNNKTLIIIATLFILFVLCAMFYQKKSSMEEDVHFHAGFHIYTDNRLMEFSDTKYMHVNPCTEDDTNHVDTSEERAHLHNNIGDVVHVHSSRATWGDLLKTLRFSSNEYRTFYLNGKLAPSLENTFIHEYDQMLLLVGENENIQEKIDTLPDENRIRQAEQLTESC